MSPRIKSLRKILNPPIIKGFKPYGSENNNKKPEQVVILYEEYEALRLCDYDRYNHHQASVIMGVSRPTYTRIYASVRQKIAKAFIEGSQIVIEGGKVYFDSDWFHCKKCKCYFNNIEKEKAIENCPLCGHIQVVKFDFVDKIDDDEIKSFNDFCICLNCGYQEQHQLGKPCSHQVCPKCKNLMKRKK